MIDGLITSLTQAIVALISSSGYVGIVVLMAIESACIPLPSEIIMPFAGYLVSTGRFNLMLTATAGALGCNLGSAIAYVIGAKGGRAAVQRWGSIVLIGPAELAWIERAFDRYGFITVFVARLLPVVRTFVALPAGLAHMPHVRFHVYTFLGSWIWCLLLAYAGEKLGDRWNKDPALQALFHRADLVIVACLAVGLGALIWHRLRDRRSGSATQRGRDGR